MSDKPYGPPKDYLTPENRAFVEEAKKRLRSIGEAAGGLTGANRIAELGKTGQRIAEGATDAVATGDPNKLIDAARGPGEAKPAETKPAEEAAGDIHYADVGAYGTQPVVPPRLVPAHEVALVNPKRQEAEQETYLDQLGAIRQGRGAVAEQKAAADEAADAESVVNRALSKGDNYLAALARNQQQESETKDASDKVKFAEMRAGIRDASERAALDRIEVPDKVRWTIAKALGAIGQGLLGTSTNQVADMIDAQIRREIERQKADHATRREKVSDLKTAYDLAAAESKDEGERMRRAHAYGMEAAKREIDSLARIANNTKALAEASRLKALLSEKDAQYQEKGAVVGREAVQRGIAENKWVPAGVAGGAAKPVDGNTVFFDPDSGRHFAAKGPDSKKTLAASAVAFEEMKYLAKKYGDALSKIGKKDRIAYADGKGYTTDAMSEALSSYQKMLAAERKNLETGVYNKGEGPMLEQNLQPPQNFTGDPQTQIDLATSLARQKHRIRMKVETPDPVDRVPQPYGTSPKSIPTGQLPSVPQTSSAAKVGFAPAGAKARGGDVAHDQPYLVGEEGPELVVPNKPGFVLTALQTAALRGAPPTKQQMDTLPSGAKSAIQRFAEKAGVAREEGGGWGQNPQKIAEAIEEEARHNKALRVASSPLNRMADAARDPEPRAPREAVVEGARLYTGDRTKISADEQANRRSYETEDGETLGEGAAIRYHDARSLGLSEEQARRAAVDLEYAYRVLKLDGRPERRPVPPEWLDRYMTSEGLALPAREEGGAVSAEPDDAQLERAYQEYMAKQRAAGPKAPPTAAELAADEEAARKAMGPDQGQAKYVAPKTAEEAQWEAQQRAFEQRELERQRRLDREAEIAAQKRELEAQNAARYEADYRRSPVKAWAAKKMGVYDVRTAEEQKKRNEEQAKNSEKYGLNALMRYYEAHRADRERSYLPEWAQPYIRPTMGTAVPRREPVSFEREIQPGEIGPPPPPTRADGGEVLPLYEPEGTRLQQSLDGHAYLASASEDSPGRPSLSGPTPKYSVAKALAPKPKAAPARRAMTPEEMLRAADALKREKDAEYESRLAEGPAVRARACGGAMQPKGLAASISRDLKKTKRAG